MEDITYYVGLVHYPVFDKNRKIVTTSITNMDVHDISRTCCAYGVRNYFVINQLESQRELFFKIMAFWQSDTGKNYQPDRAEALKTTVFLDSYQDAINYIKNQEKIYPVMITTTARQRKNQLRYDSFNSVINNDTLRNNPEAPAKPVLLIFGTGYGLADEIHEKADYVLTPIESRSEYNHLSVRSAVAIVLDRLIPKNKGGINGHIASCKSRTN